MGGRCMESIPCAPYPITHSSFPKLYFLLMLAYNALLLFSQSTKHNRRQEENALQLLHSGINHIEDAAMLPFLHIQCETKQTFLSKNNIF